MCFARLISNFNIHYSSTDRKAMKIAMTEKKRVSDSYTENVQIVSQGHLNGFKRLFGGRLMEWIDIVAGVTARRHCGKNVTTVMVDSLCFKAAAHANDIIVLRGKITYVGKTSMEVCVKTYIESCSGQRNLINTAYFIMVAMDEEERPAEVPGLILETEEEKREWENGRLRYEKRRAERA